MTRYDLKKLFEVFISNETVSECDLLRAGMPQSLIDEYVEKKVISRLGNMCILNRNYIGELNSYGDILLSKGDVLRASNCYNLSLKIKSRSDVKYKKFVCDIKMGNYNEALKYFDLSTLKNSDLESFYLYVIGLMYNLPKYYKIFANEYRKGYSENKFKITNDFKKVIRLFFRYSFNLALKELDLIDVNGDNVLNIEICRDLITACKQKLLNVNSIYYYLSIDKLDIATELTIDYLYDNRKGEYNRLVKALIKLSHELGDTTYKLPMDILTNLDDIKIDYKYFVIMFNEAFKSHSISKAKCVLKVLVELNKLGICQLDLEVYEKTLTNVKKR